MKIMVHRFTTSGRPLLCLHGLARGGVDFMNMKPLLEKRWAMYALDFHGHGESERRPGHYLVTDYIPDAITALDVVFRERGEPVTLLGHSLGAMVALAVAGEAPDKVRAAVLEDPPFHTMGNRIGQTIYQAQFTGTREVARAGGDVPTLAANLAAVRIPAAGGGFTTFGQTRSPEALLASAAYLARVDPEIFTPPIEARWLDGYDREAMFARARCPILLMQGDPATGAALTDEDVALARRVTADCRHVMVAGAPHQIHATQPEKVAALVNEFGG